MATKNKKNTNDKINKVKSKVQLDEKLDIVENSVNEQENIDNSVTEPDDISLNEIEETIKQLDLTVDVPDDMEIETPSLTEIEKIVEEIEKIDKSKKDFNEKFDEVQTNEEAENLIKTEIEKTEQLKEDVQKIIKKLPKRNFTTNSWNGMYYGY